MFKIKDKIKIRYLYVILFKNIKFKSLLYTTSQNFVVEIKLVSTKINKWYV